MKRLVPVLAIALLLTACGGSDTTDPAPGTTSAADATPADEPPTSAAPTSAAPSAPIATSGPPATGGGAGIATVAVDGGPTLEFELSSCRTSTTDPDIFLLPDSFQVSGEADGLSFSADWLSADGEGYFGLGVIAPEDGSGQATFEPDDLTTSNGTVSGDVTFSVLGEVEGITDGSTGTITFGC